MVTLTTAASQSKPSIYREMAMQERALKEKGASTIPFTIGDPTQAASPWIIDYLIRYALLNRGLEQGLLSAQQVTAIAEILGLDLELVKVGKPRNYTPFQGDVSLRADTAEYFNKRHNTTYNENNVIFTTGANTAMDLAIQICEGPFIVPEPGFRLYHAQLIKHKREALTYETTPDNFVITTERLDRVLEEAYQKALETNPALERAQFACTFVFTDSGNPTGYKHSRKQLEDIHNLLTEKWGNVNVIADCLYFELAHKQENAITILDIAAEQRSSLESRIVFVDSISKADSFPNLRGGYMVSQDDNFITKAGNAQLANNVHPSVESQIAVTSALKHRTEYVRQNADAYAYKAQIMQKQLRGTDIANKFQANGGFYAMIDLSFMRNVTLSEATIDAANKFMGEDAVRKHREAYKDTVGDSEYLASTELATRTGVFSVPIAPVQESTYIKVAEIDKERTASSSGTKPLLARIVPSLTIEQMQEAGKRLVTFYQHATTGQHEKLSKEPPQQKVTHEHVDAAVIDLSLSQRLGLVAA